MHDRYYKNPEATREIIDEEAGCTTVIWD